MKSILFKVAIPLAAITCTVAANCQQTASTTNSSPNAVLYYPSSQVAASFEKGTPLLEGKDRNYGIITGHRDKPGQSELHERDTDVFYVVEGSASFVTGGKMLEGKSTGPYEVRGSGIDGGDTHQLNKGDVIIIPAGVPHWFKDVKSTFLYLVVKVRPQS